MDRAGSTAWKEYPYYGAIIYFEVVRSTAVAKEPNCNCRKIECVGSLGRSMVGFSYLEEGFLLFGAANN